MLAPGDRFTKLVERELIEQAALERAEELNASIRAAGVVAGQTIALVFGADPNAVVELGKALMSGGETDGDR